MADAQMFLHIDRTQRTGQRAGKADDFALRRAFQTGGGRQVAAKYHAQKGDA